MSCHRTAGEAAAAVVDVAAGGGSVVRMIRDYLAPVHGSRIPRSAARHSRNRSRLSLIPVDVAAVDGGLSKIPRDSCLLRFRYCAGACWTMTTRKMRLSRCHLPRHLARLLRRCCCYCSAWTIRMPAGVRVGPPSSFPLCCSSVHSPDWSLIQSRMPLRIEKNPGGHCYCHCSAWMWLWDKLQPRTQLQPRQPLNPRTLTEFP